MKSTISPPLSRALAAAILLGLVGLAYYGAIAPIVDAYQSSHRSIVQLRAELSRYERVGSALPARRDELAALRRRQWAQDGFLQGPSDTLVAAQIQNRLKRLVEAGKGQLQSTQILPPRQEGAVRRITVRAQMSATLGGMLHVFYALESGYPLLFLDNVDIRKRPAQYGRGVARMDDDVLDVQFDIYGYMRGKSAKPAPASARSAGLP